MRSQNADAVLEHGVKTAQANTHDSNLSAPTPVSQAKRLSSVQAALAFHGGFSVHELLDGGFFVCRMNTFYRCIDLPALEALAKQASAV